MVQWINNPTTVTWVTKEVHVPSPAQCSELKDPALLQLQCRSSCGSDSRFDLWPENFHMPLV